MIYALQIISNDITIVTNKLKAIGCYQHLMAFMLKDIIILQTSTSIISIGIMKYNSQTAVVLIEISNRFDYNRKGYSSMGE